MGKKLLKNYIPIKKNKVKKKVKTRVKINAKIFAKKKYFEKNSAVNKTLLVDRRHI